MTALTNGTTTRRWLSSHRVLGSWGSALLLLALPASLAAQSVGTLKGVVIDIDSTPLGDARVMLLGTLRGTLTDSHGRFALSGIRSGVQLLRVNRIGFKEMVSRV